MKYRNVSIVWLLVVSCTTPVLIRTDPEKLDAYYRGRHLGKTPVSAQFDDASWEEYYVEFRDGEKSLQSVKLEKEVKVSNAVAGFCLCGIPWLWAYGPRSDQYFKIEMPAGHKITGPGGNFRDSVILKSGQKYEGVKAAVTGDSIVIVTQDGKTMVFKKVDVQSLEKGN